MGKRKRSSGDHNNTKCTSSSDDLPCSSGTDLLSREKSYLLESSESRPLMPMVDTSDNTVKVLNAQHSHAHQNNNLGRSIVLKRSRHYYGHQYSRRNLGSHADASTSHGKTALSRNERLTFKLISQPGSKPGCHTENKEIEFSRPDRVRFSSLVMNTVSSDAVKMFAVMFIIQNVWSRKQVLKICVTLPAHCARAWSLKQMPLEKKSNVMLTYIYAIDYRGQTYHKTGNMERSIGG
ncbi:PREDICTED: uncharacterized protein LOC105122667 isoform X2 [Populus euphratica]|uniref:Uncharacterized protein LOC105122667 isoform X2 n=1 Tax=Populus euphratica TaxID=75702 RepID=A0AAJ6TYY8_POPEU|nr:PREDICTED: uncharacterized protein LOC105122667 isoform X2 [Populus euphratica]